MLLVKIVKTILLFGSMGLLIYLICERYTNAFKRSDPTSISTGIVLGTLAMLIVAIVVFLVL